MQEYSVLGKRVPRVDAKVKVTGDARYTFDVVLPRMLYGAILRSPYSHARILSIDTSRAEKMPGVKAVLTGREIVDKWDVRTAQEPVLALNYVQFIGQGVAAVAAVDPYTAAEALKLIDVKYEKLPAVLDLREAMQEGSPPANTAAASNVSGKRIFQWGGDVEKGFSQADYIREDEFCPQIVHVCYLETTVSVADFSSTGNLTFWVSVQAPDIIRSALASSLKLNPASVRVIVPYVGGAHSNKNGPQNYMLVTALLSRKSGRPVKLGLTREELLTEGRGTAPLIIKMKTGVKKDGTLLALRCQTAVACGPFVPPSGLLEANDRTFWMLATYLPFPYRVPNIRFEGQAVMTNHVYGGQRGTSRTPICYAYECHIDRIAADLKIDPLEMRKRNAIQTGDILVNGGRLHSFGLSECLQKVSEMTHWQERKGKTGRNRGLGIACYNYNTGSRENRSIAGAFVQVHADGTAQLVMGETELGQGADTVMSQIVAEELGLRLDQVTVNSQIDTDICPVGSQTQGSMGTDTSGNAVRAAAEDARRQVLQIAAGRLGVKAEDLDIRQGLILAKNNPEKHLSFSELVRDACFREGKTILGKGAFTPDWEPKDSLTGNMKDVPPSGSGAMVMEVEVDTETGHTRVIKASVAHDIGFALNPALVEGQIEGQLQFGIGQALYEDHRTEEGRVLTATFTDYRIPRTTDMPEVEIALLEIPDPRGPYGGKECGEGPQAGVAPAVINAIYDAVGVRLNDMPATPEKILRALKEKGERQ